MKPEIKRAYKAVIKDIKENRQKCESYAMGCFNCAVERMVEDLEMYFDLVKE